MFNYKDEDEEVRRLFKLPSPCEDMDMPGFDFNEPLVVGLNDYLRDNPLICHSSNDINNFYENDFCFGEDKIQIEDAFLLPEINIKEFQSICVKNDQSDSGIDIKTKDTIKENSDVNTTPKTSLSLRADVMNKNIIRAFRRQSKGMFDNFLKSKLFGNFKLSKNSQNLKASLPKLKRIFVVNLLKFTTHLLENTQVGWRDLPEFNQEKFMKYLGVFVNY